MRGTQFRRKIKRAMSVWTLANFIPASAGIRGKMNLSTSHISGNCVEVDANLAEIPSRDLQKEMVVIRHQTEAVDLRAISLCR